MQATVWKSTLLAWSILAIAPGARGQVTDCALNGEPHPYGVLTFITNSRLGPPTVPGYRKSVRSCVTQNDPINFLYVHWLIPGPDGWVPPGKVLEALPRDTNLDTYDKLKGCLLYGNRGETTHGTFIGIERDDKLVKDEEQRGCREAVANPQASLKGIGLKGIGKFIIDFLNYFPSNASRPRETMLQLKGTVGVFPSSATSYTSIVSYTITPYEKSEGSPTDLSIRPVFRGSAERFISAFYKENENPRRLSVRPETSGWIA